MKKFIIIAALVVASCAAMYAADKPVANDTVLNTMTYHLTAVKKTNDFGEVKYTYYAVLISDNGKQKKVSINKTTYESDIITHLVYAVYADGSRKLKKAICDLNKVNIVQTKSIDCTYYNQ